jgi:NAD(P)-dependent dehydrogenase (short-subunit alcohol dehydrogenase family)
MITTGTGGAIVTGAGSGIGRAVTLALATQGIPVLAVDVNESAAAETAAAAAEDGLITAHQADVSDAAQVQRYVAAAVDIFGPPTRFFNNAGVEGVHRSIIDTSAEDWRRVVSINLDGVFWGLKYVLPFMRDNRAGAVVNTGSILSVKAAPDRSDYVATKHAVLGLTRSAAAEMAPYGVRVTCIMPGPIDTPLMERSETLVNPNDPGQERQRFIAGTPLGRYGTPTEVAETVLFLLRPDVAYLTGAAIAIDGGITSV